MLTLGPGVVCGGEGSAALDGRVAVGPELDEGMRRGIGEGGFAELLEGLLRDYLRVGDDAVDGLLPVDVGGVLDGAAEGVFDGSRDEGKYVQHQQQNGEAGPVVLRADVPARTEAAQHPLGQLLPEEEGDEQQQRGEGEAQADVVQDVVAKLVAEDGGDLVGRGVGDGRVPEDEPTPVT